MARLRAADYDDKRRGLLTAAARLFADHGYDRTSLAEVARACGVSKALFYHYYSSKDVLLFDILKGHLEDLLAAVTTAAEEAAGLTPADRLEAIAVALLDAYRDADAQHTIQINEMPKLPAEQQQELRGLERALVRIFSHAIAAANPRLAETQPPLLMPVTMSLFGMLNWHYLWFRPNGPLSREAYARLAVKIAIEGSRAVA